MRGLGACQVEHYYNEFFVSLLFSLLLYERHLTMSCNEKVLKLNHWKVELDSTRESTHTHIYRVRIRHRKGAGVVESY